MTGVEILAMEEVVTKYAWNWAAHFITIFIFALLCALIFLSFSNPFTRMQEVICGIFVGALFGAVLGILPASLTLPDEYETNYKVIISDEVSMNEFLSKYEIIDQEGKIYTVREIEDGE